MYRGDAYFKANYFHDFAGDGSVTTGSVTYESDQPKNWWELGIGGDVKMGKTPAPMRKSESCSVT